MSTLMSIIESASIFQKINPLDNYIALTDIEGEILFFSQPKTFKMNVKVGDKVASQGANAECIRTKKEIHKIIPKEIYGIVVKVISTPVFEEDKFVGVLTAGVSFETQQQLHSAAENIAATSEELTATVEEIATTATQLAEEFDNVQLNNERVFAEIKKTEDILKFVSDVAANSNLLGLNAAIEAARAGEHGRGFTVVADEIRKMATNSEHSVKNIKMILQNIQNENAAMAKTIIKTSQMSERQAAATEQISASMQQLTMLATDIERIAEII